MEVQEPPTQTKIYTSDQDSKNEVMRSGPNNISKLVIGSEREDQHIKPEEPFMWRMQVRFPYIYIYTTYIGTEGMNQVLEVCAIMPYHMFDWDHKADGIQLTYAYWERITAEALIGLEWRYEYADMRYMPLYAWPTYSFFLAFAITCEESICLHQNLEKNARNRSFQNCVDQGLDGIKDRYQLIQRRHWNRLSLNDVSK